MFFLTTLNSSPGKNIEPRCVGYFENLADAQAVLEKNLGDLAEDGYYNLAVIEEIGPGLYAAAKRERYWYCYHDLHKEGIFGGCGWRPSVAPHHFERTTNFAIG